MNGSRTPRILSERTGKWVLSLFPPLLFGRVRVVSVAPGFRACRVRVARSLLTRNLNGTTFGGTIFSASDPFYAVLYWQVFARERRRVMVWLKSAKIRYLRPAAGTLWLEFALSDAQIAEATEALDRDGKFEPNHVTEARDEQGAVCAVIETRVHLRAEPGEDRGGSAF